jgi:hypothetical protein
MSLVKSTFDCRAVAIAAFDDGRHNRTPIIKAIKTTVTARESLLFFIFSLEVAFESDCLKKSAARIGLTEIYLSSSSRTTAMDISAKKIADFNSSVLRCAGRCV